MSVAEISIPKLVPDRRIATRHLLRLLCLCATSAACGGEISEERGEGGTSATSVGSLPVVGLAMLDTLGQWCASVDGDSLATGQVVTIVFPDSGGATSVLTRVVARRPSPCRGAFPQPALEDFAAWELAPVDSSRAAETFLPIVGIAVAGEAPWRRDADGVTRADLDADGVPEEARVCAADEGQHFTLWTVNAAAGGRRRLWRGYFDWGVLVDPTCTPEDTVAMQPA